MAVAGQEQRAWWEATSHWAHRPQGEEEQGFSHWELMQAWLAPHWESEVQPATQNLSRQMEPSPQSALLLQSGRQVPWTQTSLRRQFSLEEEHLVTHCPATHL